MTCYYIDVEADERGNAQRLLTTNRRKSAMAKGHNITAEFVRAILDYDPETGVLTWKRRGPDSFVSGNRQSAEHKCNAWNAKFEGRICGCVNSIGYWQVTIHNKHYLGHRIAWLWIEGSWPKDEIDHADMNSVNNRWSNLREATRAENGWNKKKKGGSGSALKGACFDRARSLWTARGRREGKTICLGRFKTEREAHEAYLEFADKNYGIFARSG